MSGHNAVHVPANGFCGKQKLEKYLKVKDVFKQFTKLLSQVVAIAHRTTGADLPDLDDIYSSRRPVPSIL